MPQTSLSLEPLRCLVAQIWTMHLFFSLILATMLCIKKSLKEEYSFFCEDKGEDVNEPPTEAKPGCSNSTEAFSNLNESASYREGKLNCMLQ